MNLEDGTWALKFQNTFIIQVLLEFNLTKMSIKLMTSLIVHSNFCLIKQYCIISNIISNF